MFRHGNLNQMCRIPGRWSIFRDHWQPDPKFQCVLKLNPVWCWNTVIAIGVLDAYFTEYHESNRCPDCRSQERRWKVLVHRRYVRYFHFLGCY